jgi:Arginine repressor
MKARRQALLLELVDREPLRSQEQLRRRLHQRGFEATQATISRDIKDGLVKRAGDGAYQRPGIDTLNPDTALAALERATAELLRRVDRVQQMVVIRTGPGQAQPLALALDRAQ